MTRYANHFAGVIAGLGLTFFLVAVSAHADDAKQSADDQADIDRLTAIWQGNASEVKTAYVKYRALARGPAKVVTRQDVLVQLETKDFVKRPEDARLISDAFGLELDPDRAAWGTGELYVSRNKVRANRDYEDARFSEDVLTENTRVIFSRLNDQIDVYFRGGSHNRLMSLNDFRVIPKPTDQLPATIEKRMEDRLVVRIGPQQFVVDEETGFVHSVRRNTPPDGPSQSSVDCFQRGRLTFPDGIVFPAAVTTCHYLRDELKIITVNVLESATFNEPIKDEVFVLAAPAGSKVFDSRLKRGWRGYFNRIIEPVPDVIAELYRIAAERK